MARKKRIEYGGALYHVYSRGNENRLIAEHTKDWELFSETLGGMCKRFNVDILALVLMPEHYHLLLKTNLANLSKSMQWFGTAYTRRRNARDKRRGRLFQGRFKNILIENVSILTRLSCYIHRNPIRAGITQRMDEYKWSSYPVFSGKSPSPPWLNIEPILSQINSKDRHKGYSAIVRKSASKEVPPWREIRHGLILGSKPFIDTIRRQCWYNKKGLSLDLGEKPDIAHVLEKASILLGCGKKQFTTASRRPSFNRENRDMLMYHLYQKGVYSNKEIGGLFNITYSAISQRIKSIRKKKKQDKTFSQKIEKFDDMMALSRNDMAVENQPDQSMTPATNQIVSPLYGENGRAKRPDKGINPGGKSMLMRERLIEATLDCLQKFGYHGASLSRILEKAGVSRGGWQYHFSNKNELVAAAAEYIYKNAIEKTITAARVAPEFVKMEDPIEGLLDFIWANFHQGRHRDVWLEFTVACRTDAELRNRIMPVIKTFFSELDKIWSDHFSITNLSSIQVEALMNLTLYTMRGMAIQALVHDDEPGYRYLRSIWIKMITPLVKIKMTKFP